MQVFLINPSPGVGIAFPDQWRVELWQDKDTMLVRYYIKDENDARTFYNGYRSALGDTARFRNVA